MLSRVANALYWMGRYVERTEHLARYLNVQYFSILDAPMSQKREFALNSILNMAGLSEEIKNQLPEDEILIKIALDAGNDASIIASVQSGRENARSIRSVISTKLWESVNKYYHFVQNYPKDIYKTRGLYDFCVNVIQHCAVIRADIENTIIHNEVHAIISLGIHLERAIQTTRILSTKLADIAILKGESKEHHLIQVYQWTITLKVLEAFDVSYRYYKKFPSKQDIIEFLVTNTYFPRSIAYNIGKANTCIQSISTRKIFTSDTPEFYADKITSYYKFLEYEEISDLQDFLENTLENIYKLHNMLEENYISY